MDDVDRPDPTEDPIYLEEIAAISRELEAGDLVPREYNARRRAALEAARARVEGKAAAPVAVEAVAIEAVAPPSEPATSEAAMPSAWAEVADAGPKYWTASGRGDDPSVRVVHPPLSEGIGSGKSFLFVFGLKKARAIDQKMVEREMQEIADDVEVLRNAGYTVVVDPEGGKQDFLQALYGEGEGVEGLVPAGIYWSAHGFEDGAIECCDGGRIAPGEVETVRVSPGLKLVVFGACYTGSWAHTWRRALGDAPLVVGWGRPVTIDRAVEFLQSDPDTDTDLDDLIARYLLTDTPVPPPRRDDGQPAEAAARRGRKTDLAERVSGVAAILGARYREGETWWDVWVPLPERRHHVVKLFVLDATLPYAEGKALVGVEADVGELTAVVEPQMLLRDLAEPGYARVVLARGRADLPDILVQGFFPLSRVSDAEIAALVYHAALSADGLERKIFGGDRPD